MVDVAPGDGDDDAVMVICLLILYKNNETCSITRLVVSVTAAISKNSFHAMFTFGSFVNGNILYKCSHYSGEHCDGWRNQS